MRLLQRFWRSERGNTGVLFAFSAIPLIGCLGGAVDFAMQGRESSVLQSSLDAAALAAARSIAEDIGTGANRADYKRAEERASQVFAASIGQLGGEPELVFSHEGTRVVASSSWQMPATFLPVLGIDTLTVHGSAEADIQASTETCVYVTEPVEFGVSLRASSEFAANCGVRVESRDARAISLMASSDMQATEICANGEAYLRASSTISPLPSPCLDEYRDPLQHLGVPERAAGGCDFRDLTIKGKSLRLRPGVYCGTTTLSPASHAVLEPGEYVFRDGEFAIGSGSSAAGEDVLLYFQGHGAGLNVGHGSRFEGHGRLSGEFAGVLVYVDRECDGCANLVNAGGTASLEGTVYAPHAPFTVQSRASAVTAAHTQLVVRQLILESSASLAVDLGAGGVPLAYTDVSLVRLVK